MIVWSGDLVEQCRGSISEVKMLPPCGANGANACLAGHRAGSTASDYAEAPITAVYHWEACIRRKLSSKSSPVVFLVLRSINSLASLHLLSDEALGPFEKSFAKHSPKRIGRLKHKTAEDMR